MKKVLYTVLFILSVAGLQAQSCNSYFTYEVDSLNNVTFTDSSTATGTIISWYWYLNGDTSSNQNVTHTFNPGVHAVCLSISTDDSCTSSFCDTLTINQINPCLGFSASFNITNSTNSITNDGSVATSLTGGTPPFLYFWDTGDSTANIQNLIPGTYCLTVIDSDSCIYSDCATVLADTISYCNAEYYSNSGNCINCFQYTDTSSSSSSIMHWFWDFGDGNSSSLQNPSHVFLDSGYYNVCLTIVTADSCVSTFCDSLYISQSITSYFISGHVFHGSTSLVSGTVELYETNLEWHHPPLYSETVFNGDFLFPHVASGTYKLLAIPDYPVSMAYASTYFGDKTDWSDAYTLSLFSNLISVDVHLQENTSSINSLDQTNDIRISPNPFSNFLSIDSKKLINSITIQSLSGEILFIKEVHSHNISINTNFLCSGIYIASVLTDDKIYCKKIIKL